MQVGLVVSGQRLYIICLATDHLFSTEYKVGRGMVPGMGPP
jgi:hypothetical protein